MSERASQARSADMRGPRDIAQRFRGVQVQNERAHERSREEGRK